MSQLGQATGARSSDGSTGGRRKGPHPNDPGSIGPELATFGPIAWETLPWQPGYDIEALSRRRRDALPTSYTAAIPAEIAGRRFEISTALAAEAEDAAATIIKLDAYVSARFQEEIAPMQSVLLRSEAAASSRIENLTVGAKQLAIAELGGAASKNAELVSKNVRAMDAAIRLSDNLSTESILAMHQALLGDEDPTNAGRWRDVQVWIGASGLSPADATFIPPQAHRVPDAMEDLARFLARDDLPVLVQAAIAHAQFETIHPFTDGNGRTGRALLHAMLRHSELTSRVTVPISAGLLTDTRSYFDSLTAYRSGGLSRIVEQVCDASRVAAGHGRWLVDSLAEVQDDWAKTMQARAGSAGRKLLNILIGQPAINVTYVEQTLAVSNTAARRAVEQAVTAGILVETSDRRRDRVFLARDVIDVLDEFSGRAGRRA